MLTGRIVKYLFARVYETQFAAGDGTDEVFVARVVDFRLQSKVVVGKGGLLRLQNAYHRLRPGDFPVSPGKAEQEGQEEEGGDESKKMPLYSDGQKKSPALSVDDFRRSAG